MSMEIYESAKSGGDLDRKASKGQTDKRIYVVMCDAGETGTLATEFALGFAPLAVQTPEAQLIAIGATPRILAPMDSSGRGSYEVEISYAEEDDKDSQERPQPGTWHFDIDSGESSQRITRSLEQISYGGPDGGSTPNLDRVLGWDGREAKGIDVPVANPEFSITAYYKAKNITTAFFANLCDKAFHTNENAWLGFPAGTLLFVSHTGNGDIPTVAGQRVKPIPIRFRFRYSKNLTNINLGDSVIVPSKKGWQYLDVEYMPKASGTSVVAGVKRWSVHRLFEEMDFAEEFGFNNA